MNVVSVSVTRRTVPAHWFTTSIIDIFTVSEIVLAYYLILLRVTAARGFFVLATVHCESKPQNIERVINAYSNFGNVARVPLLR